MAGFVKRQFRKVIQWENADPNVIVWKFPLERKEEIMNKSQLVVREGQKAMFVQEGKLADTFSAGTYELDDIRNIPILTAMAKWKFAWESPYTGDVIFVSTKQFINNKWGTANPIMMRDPDFGVIRVRGFGTFSFAVSNPALALSELIGAVNELTVGNVNEYFKKIIASVLSNVIAESKYPALELAAHYDELADMAKIKLEQNFGEIGIEVKALFIEVCKIMRSTKVSALCVTPLKIPGAWLVWG
ncbi:MAG: SPFH domain-containing protein [Clostridia bacterium]